MTHPISCQLHDYIEMACLYGYRVRLTMRDGQTVDGKAEDTAVDSGKREYLVLDGDRRVELNKLSKMEVLAANPLFDVVEF